MSAVAQTYRFTVDEYHKLVEVGILDEDDRVELLDGEIILMSPIGYRHAKAVRRLLKLFIQKAEGRFEVDAQDPVIISDHSEPQPDLLLLDPVVDQIEGGVEAQHTFLVIEVADATLRYDRGPKLRAYARAGLPELWIVNLGDNVIEVYRDPSGETYREQRVVHGSDVARPLSFPDVEIAADRIVS